MERLKAEATPKMAYYTYATRVVIYIMRFHLGTLPQCLDSPWVEGKTAQTRSWQPEPELLRENQEVNPRSDPGKKVRSDIQPSGKDVGEP